MDDADLVAAARRGDESAWAGIYDRYADRLHDHCHRILRDRDEAADALHDAFLAAARNLEQLRDPSRLRPWLYSICRHTSLRRLRARDRIELTDEPDDLMATDSEPDRGVRQEELAALVWAAAAGLNGRDQALLDLNLRQGLEGQDLADAMGTSLNNSYVMLSRLRDQVERSLGALLIARLGRDDCEELAGLLTDWDGTFSPLVRKRVARHVDRCETCAEKRKSVVSPLALLGVAPLLPAPSLLKARVISSIRNVEVVDSPPIRFTDTGYAVLDRSGERRTPRGAWLATAAAVLLLLGGFFLAGRGDDDPSLQTAASEQTSTSFGERRRVTTTTLEDDSTSTTEAGDDDTERVGGGSPTDDGDPDDPGPGTTATTRPGDTTTSTDPGPSTTATTAPPRGGELFVTRGPIYTSRCESGPKQLQIIVEATPEFTKMVAFVQRVGSGIGQGVTQVPLTNQGDGRWTGTAGPFSGEADLDIWVNGYVPSSTRPVHRWPANNATLVREVVDCETPTTDPPNSITSDQG